MSATWHTGDLRRALTIAGLFLVTGCLVDVTYPVGLRCLDLQCPDDQICVEGVCVASADPDAGTPDAGDSGGSTRVCGGSAALALDFDDGDAWFFDNLGGGELSDSGLRLSAAINDATTASGGPRLDLLDSHWFARLEHTSGIAIFSIVGDGREVLAAVDGAELILKIDDDEVRIPYSATEHAYVGFRERDGQLEWITSPDGVTHTARRSIAAPDFVQAFQATMTTVSLGAPSDVVFSELNGSSTHSFCKATAFSDDFEDGVIDDPRWSYFGACSINEEGGELRFVASGGQFCVVSANNIHDLADSEFVLELGSVFSGYFKFAARTPTGEVVAERFDTEVRFTDCPGGVCGAPIAAPYVGERYWRLRGNSDGTVVFAISSDGVDYAPVGTSSAHELSSSSVRFHGNVDTENRSHNFN